MTSTVNVATGIGILDQVVLGSLKCAIPLPSDNDGSVATAVDFPPAITGVGA